MLKFTKRHGDLSTSDSPMTPDREEPLHDSMAQSGQVHTEQVRTGTAECSPRSPLSAGAELVSRVAISSRTKTVELAPSRGFNPPAEEVLRWCIALAQTRRTFHRDFVRIHLRGQDGKLSWHLSSHPEIVDLLCQRVPPGLTIRESPTVPTFALMQWATARVILPASPREVPSDPDILGDFARIFADIEGKEFAEVFVDLCAADKPSQREGFSPPRVDLHALVSDLRHHATTDLLAGPKPAPRVAPKSSPKTTADVPSDKGLFFRVSVHSHAFAESRSRARDLAVAVASPFHAWGPGGSVRVSSRVPSGEWLREGHRPRGRSSRVLPQSVLAGLLLPPTESCAAPNVARTPASASVPAGVPQLGPGVWPQGLPEGFAQPFGVPAKEVLFSVLCGQPEYGKTSLALTQLTSQTLPWPGTSEIPAGGAFVDPHMDGVRDLLPFYWQDPSRVLYMGLGDSWDGMWMPVYNPIDCRGVSPQEAERRVSAVVGGLSVAAGWDMKATRSLPIATKAVELLVAMARGLGPNDPVPTVFQIPMVCMDEKSRKVILRDERIPNSLRRWWENEGASYKPDAFGPVTQIISRIRSSVPLAAFMGGRSTFTPREAMDAKMVMLFGGLMSGDNEKDRLAVALFVRMLIQAAYSRGDVPREQRAERCPPFYCMIDELPTCDGADLPKIFMELRKFMFRCQVMAVTPAALKSATWAAAVTAASIITTTSLNGAGANMLTTLGLWKDFDPRDLGEIEKYHHLTSITFQGRKHPPIAIKGMQPGDIFEARPGVVEASIPRNPRYRRVSDIMEELEDLDERLLAAWTGEGPKRSGVVSIAMPEDA